MLLCRKSTAFSESAVVLKEFLSCVQILISSNPTYTLEQTPIKNVLFDDFPMQIPQSLFQRKTCISYGDY